MGETRNPGSIFDGHLTETEHLEDLGINGRLTLN
jgi:hypothetical protein